MWWAVYDYYFDAFGPERLQRRPERRPPRIYQYRGLGLPSLVP
jgi:hypothetical protein